MASCLVSIPLGRTLPGWLIESAFMSKKSFAALAPESTSAAENAATRLCISIVSDKAPPIRTAAKTSRKLAGLANETKAKIFLVNPFTHNK